MERCTMSPARAENDVTGVVTNIQHFSVHDGPGIRTLVFLKGCPLRCLWCGNPETQAFRPEIGSVAERCRPGCSACREACPAGALARGPSGVMLPDTSFCRECAPLSEGRPPCAAACTAGALRVYGTRRGAGEILDEVEQDIHILPSLKNKEIIKRCSSQGIFQIKSAVTSVAKILNISKNTVYLHLKSLE